MDLSKTSPHTLFDPASQYNRLRTGFRLEDKMRGFFRSLDFRRQKALLSLGTVVLPASASSLVSEPAPLMMSAKAVRPTLVFRADRPEVPVEARVDVLLGRTMTGEPTIGLSLGLNPSDHPGERVACRVYLLEPDLLAQLQRRVSTLSGDHTAEELIRKLFANEIIASNFEAARILSAAPELVGTIDETGRGLFREFTLPDTRKDPEELLNDVHLVVVIEHPAE